MFTILFRGQSVSISQAQLQTLGLLRDHGDLQRTGSYTVKSDVSEPVFRTFMQKLFGESPQVTKENYPGLKLLCQEFVFTGFDSDFQRFNAESCHAMLGSGVPTLPDVLLSPEWPQSFNAKDPSLFELYLSFLIPASSKMFETSSETHSQ